MAAARKCFMHILNTYKKSHKSDMMMVAFNTGHPYNMLTLHSKLTVHILKIVCQYLHVYRLTQEMACASNKCWLTPTTTCMFCRVKPCPHGRAMPADTKALTVNGTIAGKTTNCPCSQLKRPQTMPVVLTWDMKRRRCQTEGGEREVLCLS